MQVASARQATTLVVTTRGITFVAGLFESGVTQAMMMETGGGEAMDHGVVHFEIPGDDPDELAGFYRDLFGWQIDKVPMEGTQGAEGVDYWIVRTVATDEQGMPTQPGGINGGLTKRQAPEQRPINYVNVESVDQYVQRARALGASVMIDKMPVPGMGWFAWLLDPQGNPFGVWQTGAPASFRPS